MKAFRMTPKSDTSRVKIGFYQEKSGDTIEFSSNKIEVKKSSFTFYSKDEMEAQYFERELRKVPEWDMKIINVRRKS